MKMIEVKHKNSKVSIKIMPCDLESMKEKGYSVVEKQSNKPASKPAKEKS